MGIFFFLIFAPLSLASLVTSWTQTNSQSSSRPAQHLVFPFHCAPSLLSYSIA